MPFIACGKRVNRVGWIIFLGLVFGSAGDFAFASEASDAIMLPAKFKKLLPLHTPLGEPSPGDWRFVHQEPGQTFRQYVRNRPVKADPKRRVLYVQPLGDFTASQRAILDRTAEYMKIYFGLPVIVRDRLPLSLIPEHARRRHPLWRTEQILTRYVLNDLLRPMLLKDAAAMIALTTSDLWPGGNWNFVFGMASLRDRVGIWAIYRYGDPARSQESFHLCLRRTMHVSTHETGHMFSMAHCTAYECNMCGSNHLEEADRYPLWLCPYCLAKLCYATDVNPERRFERLIAFCKANGFPKEQEFYEKSLAAMRAK